MNPVAQEALRALHAEGFPTREHLCQQWARMVVESALGGKPMGQPNPPSARTCALRLLERNLAFPAAQIAGHGGLQPGDLLYKTLGSGGSGHVGVYVGPDQVAENSSYHWNKSGGTDARGIRTLAQFGAFQVVARFPIGGEASVVTPDVVSQPVSAPGLSLDFEGHLVEAVLSQDADGRALVQLRPLADALGLQTGFDAKTGRISLARKTR